MPQLRNLNLDDNQLKNLPEELQLSSSIDQISIKGKFIIKIIHIQKVKSNFSFD